MLLSSTLRQVVLPALLLCASVSVRAQHVVDDFPELPWSEQALVCVSAAQAFAQSAVRAAENKELPEQTRARAKREAVEHLKAHWRWYSALARVLDKDRFKQGLESATDDLAAAVKGSGDDLDKVRALAQSCKWMAEELVLQGLITRAEDASAEDSALSTFSRLASKSTTKKSPANSERLASGTAFVVAPGYLLTNQHVVEAASEVRVLVKGRTEPIVAKVVASDKEQDLALLRAPGTGPALPLAKPGTAKVGTSVFVLGYPLAGQMGEAQKAAFGRVSATVGVSKRYGLQVDLQVQPGSSGSPVVTDEGQVVGIVTAVLDQKTLLAAAGVTASNFGFAQDVSALRGFLQKHGVRFEEYLVDDDLPGVIKQTAPSVHLLLVERNEEPRESE